MREPEIAVSVVVYGFVALVTGFVCCEEGEDLSVAAFVAVVWPLALVVLVASGGLTLLRRAWSGGR